MKVSVSIPETDLVFLDEYVQSHRIPSRSAAVQKAIGLLRASDLSQHYADAFAEWAEAGEDRVWDAAAGDGLADEPVQDAVAADGTADE